jgi:chaperonin GroEL
MTDQFYEKEGRDKLLAGAEKLYNAVRTTMGPKGRNVIIGKRGQGPTVTHDGVTVAKAVHVRDEAENIGAELIKEAANKLNDVAGDGTTTVTVLTYHLLTKAAALIDKGANPMVLARQVEAAADKALNYLEGWSLPADDLETLQMVAGVSAGDPELGRMVAEIVKRVGPTGTITVEPSITRDTTVDTVKGAVMERGYLSPYMVTNDSKAVAEYDNPAIILVNRPIYTFMEILPLLEKIAQTGRMEAVLIANEIEAEALASLVLNTTNGKFRTLCIKAPSFGAPQRQILDDFAAATGGKVIALDTVSLNDAELDVIGKAGKVIATRDKTTFMGLGDGLNERIDWLTEKIGAAGSDQEREPLEKRRANLAGQVAVIRVGGQTETEIEEKTYRVDDAVAAAKAAMVEGIIPGGGVPLYFAGDVIGTKDEGTELLGQVLREPFRQLIENSGMDVDASETALVNTINAEYKPGELVGFNVKTGELVGLLDAGIVDPYRVTKQALATGVSLGVSGMTAGAVIVEDGKK